MAAERIAETALGRLRDGRPFSEVARQFTTDPEAKAAGGDMGVVALSSLPAPLRKAVETTPGGEVSTPAQGPGGWYLLKATERTPGGIQPFSDVRAGDPQRAHPAQALRGARGLAERRP